MKTPKKLKGISDPITQFRDFHLVLMMIGIAVSVYFLATPQVLSYIHNLKDFGYVGALFAGFFFSSMITTIPATTALFVLGESLNPFLIAIIGAMGAMLADLILFSLVKHRLSHHYGLFEKIKLWFLERKFSHYIRNHRVFRYSIPLVGALIIASPLPDELGIAILGASKYDKKHFFLVALLMNFLGILAISSLNKVF